MIKLVIFDLDGTLLNTIGDINHSLNDALQKVGLPEVSIEECKYMVGSGTDLLIERVLKKLLGIQYNDEKAKYFDILKKNYLENYEKWKNVTTRPYQGIEEVIYQIRRMGIKTAVYTNKSDENAQNVVLTAIGPGNFDFIIGKRSDQKIKPWGLGIDIIKKELGIDDGIIYVGDTNIDIETAKNAGIPIIAVTWGFRKASELYEANYVIDNPEDIIAVIQYV